MNKHKVTGALPENNTKADIIPIRLFNEALRQVEEAAESIENTEYDDGCQYLLVYLEHFLYICERYVNTSGAYIYKLKRKRLYEKWEAWWMRKEKKIPKKYRDGIRQYADDLFMRLMAIKSWAVSE